MFEKTNRITASDQFSEYEKTVILKRLRNAVQKLKEVRMEIHKTVQTILGMKEAGDDIAEEAIAAVAEMCISDGNPWTLSANTKNVAKREAAKPL